MDKIVSTIIVNYNGEKWLDRSLTSLSKQNYRKNEIIVVDNASSDGSQKFIKENFPNVLLIQNRKNLGFAGGCDAGLKLAHGELILLLNNDTFVEKNFVKNLAASFEKIPNLAVAQSKIVFMDNKNIIDSCGSYWTDSSFLYHYGNGKKATGALYNKHFPVFSVKAASVMIKKSIIDKIGLFDEDFWNYYEETDFCHRAWLAGYECWYWPYAVCFHAGGGTSTTLFKYHRMQFHNFKNKLLSFIKNFDKLTLVVTVPEFLILSLFISIAWFLAGKPKYFMALWMGIFWNAANLKKTLIKRSEVQKLRKVGDKFIFSKCKRNPRLSYYFYLFKDQIKNYED